MRIIQQRDKLLSNFEVYQHMCAVQKDNAWGFTIPQKNQKRKHKFNPQLLDLEIITRDLSQYLVKVEQGNDVKTESFVKLMLVLNEYELEIIEKLMIMNSFPRSLVNLYSIIEECEDRFSQDQCEQILASVEEYFPSPADGDEDEDGGEEMEGIEENVAEGAEEDEDEEDEDAFVQDDELEHEGLIKKKNDDKEIDEVDS